MTDRDPYFDDEDEDEKSSMNYIVLIVAVIIVVIGCVVVWEMKKETNLEDCYAAGGRNCQPLPEQPSQ